MGAKFDPILGKLRTEDKGFAQGSFGITLDGNGNTISTGTKGYVTIPYNCVITGWDIFSDQVGSCVIDLWKDTYANFEPTIADSITGSQLPTLSSQQKNQNNVLDTWSTTITAGDVISFTVNSATTVRRVNVIIKVTKI